MYHFGGGGGLVARSCPVLATPWTSLPGSSVHVILQARKLKWIAISFSNLPFPSPTYIILEGLFYICAARQNCCECIKVRG